jgi:probable O-glycosylation ligase (exosortase A-associated)
MRDMAVFAVIAVWAAYALKRPWLAVLLWVFVSIANPHRLTWGFMYTAPVAQLAAIVALVGLMWTKERDSPFKGSPLAWLAIFTVWITLSWLMGFDRAGDYYQWEKVMKIYLMIFVGMALLRDKRHIFALAWVTAGSMALLGVKGGYFTIITGGNFRVWGPDGSFIEDNNEFALACVIAIPILRFLQMQLPPGWQRHAMTLVMVLTAAAAIGTHSRGSFLALIAMAFVLWWRGRNRLLTMIPILVVSLGLITFMPESWVTRMETIGEYEQDASALGRFSAWWTAWGVAKSYPFGAGFLVARHELFAAYSPYYAQFGSVHAAHSIYFQVLGNHGIVGLFLYLMIWLTTWRSASWLRKHGKKHPEARWTADLGAMVHVSLIGYMVGGAFLSLSYFDLPYNIMMLVVLARVWVQSRAWECEPVYVRGWKTVPGLATPQPSSTR